MMIASLVGDFTTPFCGLFATQKGLIVIIIGQKNQPWHLILSRVRIGCLHSWCYARGTRTDWSHSWCSHSLTWKQMIASVEENPEWTRFRKHISDAGLLLLYVLVYYAASKGAFRQRQVSFHTKMGRWMLTQHGTGLWCEDTSIRPFSFALLHWSLPESIRIWTSCNVLTKVYSLRFRIYTGIFSLTFFIPHWYEHSPFFRSALFSQVVCPYS